MPKKDKNDNKQDKGNGKPQNQGNPHKDSPKPEVPRSKVTHECLPRYRKKYNFKLANGFWEITIPTKQTPKEVLTSLSDTDHSIPVCISELNTISSQIIDHGCILYVDVNDDQVEVRVKIKY